MANRPQVFDLSAALESATLKIERKMPDIEYRKSVLRIFSKAIQLMHSQNPNCWSINIGRNGPFLLVEHEVALYTLCLTKELEIHIYLKNMDSNTRQQLERDTKLSEDKNDLWSLITIHLPEQEYLFDMIWPAFKSYVDDKARFKIHPTSIPPHLRKGAGVVEYIRLQNIDSKIPQPKYVNMPVSNVRINDLVNSFAAHSLSFTPWQVATYYTALQTKGFVILSGISGMGKTKLAQAFARLLPQPESRVVIPEALIKIVIKPYMLQYSRMIIPKSSVEFFTPPDADQTFLIELTFSDQSEKNCILRHYKYSNTDYIQLLLKGKAKSWFIENFTTNTTIVLEPKLDEEDRIVEFRMGKPEDFSKTIPVESNETPDNYLFLSVRPDWRDSKSLLGYFNPIDQLYHSTPFLEFIKRAHDSYQQKEKLAWFILLDEMNLARVEYYFSDLLSVLESGRDSDGWSREPLRLDYPFGVDVSEYEREIRLPPNLYIIGTVNVDETTHAFSPKVLDRAFTLELSDADFSNYPIQLDESLNEIDVHQSKYLLDNFTRKGKFAQIEKSEIYSFLNNDQDLRVQLAELNKVLKTHDLHFGYRVLDEITAFLANADQSGFYEDLGEDEDPLDAAILMKVLPKFHGSRTKLEEPLKAVLAWCFDPHEPNNSSIESALQIGSISVRSTIEALQNLHYQYPHTADRVIRMIRSLYTTGFASFG